MASPRRIRERLFSRPRLIRRYWSEARQRKIRDRSKSARGLRRLRRLMTASGAPRSDTPVKMALQIGTLQMLTSRV
ncbi:hypothetical protein EYF80_063083 [Liparis tanakae]|uniref:Uncharacterized protein n=1 Tax=Liparis tanakae TaxID=230148 RepID=A0A4Z2ED61_9TELE|nr:hypothetical protein EYF80_063083 [Liparis tanakae]